MTSIRRKLGPARGALQTVHGVGYRIREDALDPLESASFTRI